ncbi:MAG TPA: glucosamine-6-phosphate deaminase [Hanamia sp.]
MKIFIEKDYELMSAKAADEVMEIINPLTNPFLCTATGDSPKGLYKEMIGRIAKKNIDISDWYFVGLDEWLGMNENDEGSCRYHLNNDLLGPLRVSEKKVCFFDGSVKNIQNEIQKTDNFIKAHGGIDIAIVGLGMNGHVGMNEPGTNPTLYSHISEIDPITQKTGQKYFKQERRLTKGITLGIANLMEAGKVILLVSGSKKAGIVQKVLEEDISEMIPASLLRKHKNFSVYLDKEAASRLSKSFI